MAYFKDLSACSYFGKWDDVLLAVGWLDSGQTIPSGLVDKGAFSALVQVCANPWQPAVAPGRQRCPFCRFTGGPQQLTYAGTTVQLGTANIFVPAPGIEKIFVAPTMIVHYIDAHDYAPPAEFKEAVLGCPPMKSLEYLKRVKVLRM